MEFAPNQPGALDSWCSIPMHSGLRPKNLRLLNHLNRAYRFLGQSLCWLLFGVIGLAICFVVAPLLLLFVRDPVRRQAAARGVIRAGFRLFVALARTLRLITYRLCGMEHYDRSAGQLILANHPTLIDVVILIALFPGVDCVVKEAIIRNPFLGMAARAANYIPNSASLELLDVCAQRLRAGAGLILFPEGTRTARGDSLKFKPGAAEVALRSGACILPVIIDCRPQFLAKEESWYQIPATTPHFAIRILPPMDPRELLDEPTSERQARRSLNRALQDLFEARLAQVSHEDPLDFDHE
jgi:1-acyl-sn-glycerol-3-phosphate acyltransferase